MRFNKLIWIGFFLFLSISAYTQTSPGVYPEVLDDACINTAYLDTSTIVFIADTVVMGFTVVIDSIHTVGFINLPPGITATCLSPGCAVLTPAPGTSATDDIIFSGIPTSPIINNVITINHTLWTTIFGSVTPLPSSSEVTISIYSGSISTDTRTECDSLVWIDGNTYTTNNNTATYTLSNMAGCDSLVTLDLTINTVNTSVTQVNELLTADEAGVTYQWLNCPAMTPISGAVNQSYTASANGDYAVIVSYNGCTDTSSFYTVTGVGITENDFGTGCVLYPNPTSGDFLIDLGENRQSVKITMTDLTGKLIHSRIYNDSRLLNLKLENPVGLYLLYIESGDKKAVFRLVNE